MCGELIDDKQDWMMLNMVVTGILSGAAIGYFTYFLPYGDMVDLVVGGVIGGVLLGVIPALFYQKYLFSNRA